MHVNIQVDLKLSIEATRARPRRAPKLHVGVCLGTLCPLDMTWRITLTTVCLPCCKRSKDSWGRTPSRFTMFKTSSSCGGCLSHQGVRWGMEHQVHVMAISRRVA